MGLADAGILTVVANTGQAHPQGVKVYNLEVEQAHTYFVLAEHAPAGADAVWVHNAKYTKDDVATYDDLIARDLEAIETSLNPHLAGRVPEVGTRGTGVSRAAALEVRLAQRGGGTVDWSPDEIAYINRTGELPAGIVGHHINSVVPYSSWAGDPRNIKFVRGDAGNLLEHAGDYRNTTTGPLIDRMEMLTKIGG